MMAPPVDNRSPKERLTDLTEDEQRAYFESLDPLVLRHLLKSWAFTARPGQLTPAGAWGIWLILCGRGYGKTRTGAETFLSWVVENPVDVTGKPTEWLIAGRTYGDTVNAMMLGQSGILPRLEERGIQYHQDNKLNRITLGTGQVIHFRHGDHDNLARSLNLTGAWLDELGIWARKVREMWTLSLKPAVRISAPGMEPRILVTTTPKIGSKEALDLLKSFVQRAAEGKGVVVTRGTTFDNASNLSPSYIESLITDYPKGTLGYRQELMAELVDEIEGALWTLDVIHDNRVTLEQVPDLFKRTVAVDPAITSGPKSDLTGIIVTGSGRPVGADKDHYYVLEDKSGRYTMDQWPVVAVKLAAKHDAEIVVEVDQGGDMNVKLLQDAADELGLLVSIRTVRASSEGSKAARARPVVSLYLQGRVHHVGDFGHLEGQQTTWVPEETRKSPDRIDALVYTVRDLYEPPVVQELEPTWAEDAY